jgi:expansin
MRARGLAILCAWACGSKEPSPAPPPAPRCLPAAPPATGSATHYAAGPINKCSLEPRPLVAAMNPHDYGGAIVCGACVEVEGPGGARVVVQIVDRCPGCGPGDLDLSRDAFARLAPLERGRISIAWRQVACEVEGPIAYRFKDGSNPFWTALQIRNHRHPIASLEVRGARGGYRSLRRTAYNYFVEPRGLGRGPYALRVTDVRGQILEDHGVEPGDGVLRAGSAQFPPCP